MQFYKAELSKPLCFQTYVAEMQASCVILPGEIWNIWADNL